MHSLRRRLRGDERDSVFGLGERRSMLLLVDWDSRARSRIWVRRIEARTCMIMQTQGVARINSVKGNERFWINSEHESE
jgi:hypothetical protein